MNFPIWNNNGKFLLLFGLLQQNQQLYKKLKNENLRWHKLNYLILSHSLRACNNPLPYGTPQVTTLQALKHQS
jgi:hypothetical protein